jgi:hypothetical protein
MRGIFVLLFVILFPLPYHLTVSYVSLKKERRRQVGKGKKLWKDDEINKGNNR